MKIVNVPHPILTQKTKPVLKIDKKIRSLIKKMIKILENQKSPSGVGLAANQVDTPWQIFIIKPAAETKVETFINPRIVNSQKSIRQLADKSLKSKKTKLEGCLSIPKIWGQVRRDDKIFLEYQTLDGKKIKKWFAGFKAVIIQHEIDHLNGILFTQRVIEQKNKIYEEKEGKLELLEY